MKVLLVHNFYQQPGGEDQVFADEGNLLESKGHEVLRFTIHNDSINEMGAVALAARTVWNRDSARKLTDLLGSERPEVVHFHNTFPLVSPSAYYAARRSGAAVVQGIANYRLICPGSLLLREGRVCEDCIGKRLAWPGVKHACYRNNRRATGVIAGMLAFHRLIGTWTRAIDVYIALTRFMRGKLIEGGLPESKILVKGNFVRPDPGIGTGAGGHCLFVGRLSVEKGISSLLKAWDILGETAPALHILGDGPEADSVKAAAAANPRIRWMGRKPMAEVLEAMGNATLLMFPSEWYEGQPKVILESFAKGTPVLASRRGSMQELIEDGVNGMLFEPGNPEELAAKVRQMTADSTNLATLRSGARRTYEQKYTPETNYSELMNVYAHAIATRGSIRAGDTYSKPEVSFVKTMNPAGRTEL